MRIASFLAAMGGVAGASAELCLSDPPIQLVAGYSNISAVYDNPFGETCKAVLQFTESEFPSVTYTFYETHPCSGSHVVSFLVPLEAPNGSARLISQCAEQSSCSFVNITDGTGDPSVVSQQNSTVSCLPARFAANTSAVAVNGSITTAMGANLSDPTVTDGTPRPTAGGNRSGIAANQTSLPTASGNRSDDTATDQTLQPAAGGSRSDLTATNQTSQPTTSGNSMSNPADQPVPTALNSTANQPPRPTDTGVTAVNGAGRGWDLSSGAWTITVTQTVTTLMTSITL